MSHMIRELRARFLKLFPDLRKEISEEERDRAVEGLEEEKFLPIMRILYDEYSYCDEMFDEAANLEIKRYEECGGKVEMMGVENDCSEARGYARSAARVARVIALICSKRHADIYNLWVSRAQKYEVYK